MEEQKDESIKALESKEEWFKRLAEPRVNRALEKIKLIGNFATSKYAYTPEHAQKIIMALQGAVNEVEQKFRKRLGAKENRFEL